MFFFITVICALGLFVGVNSILDDRLRSDFFSIYRHTAIETREVQGKPVTPGQVTYYLYTANNTNEYIEINDKNLDLLEDHKIVFFIHGWINNREADWYENLKNAFLEKYNDYYIVQVDWREPANQLYYVSSINTYDVAKIIANLIADLHTNHSVGLDDILLVGHSLGGQITGFVARNVFKLTGEKLPRIIALDPAGPLFSQRPEDKRLNKEDAKIVEVIHSDGGTFGFKDPIGTIDFFPNGGSSQPGCKRIDLLDLKSIVDPVPCDHQRSYEYFIEAVLNPKVLVATKCEDWKSYKANKCETEEVPIGDLTTTARGNFYLETNKEKPYSKAKSGSPGVIKSVLGILGQ